MQSHTVRRSTSAHAALSLHSHTTRHLTARPSSLRLVGLPVRGTQTGRSVLARHQIQRLSNGPLTQTVPNPASTQPRPRHLKGLRTCVHHDRACVCCVRAWRCS